MGAPQADLTGVIIGAAATILGAAITVVVGKLWEQHLKIQDEIRAKKAPIYEKQIAALFKVLFASKITGKPADTKEMVVAFASFSEQLITWGSKDVIIAWNNYRSLGALPPGREQEGLERLEDVFFAIRKDLRNKDRGLKSGDLLGLFMNKAPTCSPNAKDAQRHP
jgi:hypothetical protein